MCEAYNGRHRLLAEETMGHTLYHTIRLGRGPRHLSRRARLALACGLAAAGVLLWRALA